MAERLWAVGNATPDLAHLTNTEHKDDACDIPANSVVHTGGKDGDFVRIPDCSDSRYFDAHHITIAAEDWTVAIWDDDDQNHKLYWSPSDNYSTRHPVPGSDTYLDVSIMIENSSGEDPVVYAMKWQYD